MEQISNTTLTKCECGQWVNYAGDPHHIARIRQIADLQQLCGRAHAVLSENFDALRGKDGYGPGNLEADLRKAADGKEHRELRTLNDELGRVLKEALNNPKLRVGKYEISRHPAGGLCMQIAEGEGAGEGMQINEDDFVRLIEGFYLEEF